MHPEMFNVYLVTYSVEGNYQQIIRQLFVLLYYFQANFILFYIYFWK